MATNCYGQSNTRSVTVPYTVLDVISIVQLNEQEGCDSITCSTAHL